MKVWHVKDAGGLLLANMNSSFSHLPAALPWIEPSINCLHQESVLSLMVGNTECAIMSMCSLMEHVLRLAVINSTECGYKRPESLSRMDKYNSMSAIIDAASGQDVFAGCDEDWWRAVSKNIRNKSAHHLLPTILRNCAVEPILRHYVQDYDLPENNDQWYYEQYITDWGAFYHRAGWTLAVRFLNDATKQLKIVIDNTNWSGDESWWISLKHSYDSFFSYEWTPDNIKQSFEMAYRECGNSKKKTMPKWIRMLLLKVKWSGK